MVRIARELAEHITDNLEKGKELSFEDRTLLIAVIRKLEWE